MLFLVVDCYFLNLQSTIENMAAKRGWMFSTETWTCACTFQSYHEFCWCTTWCLTHAITTLLITLTLCYVIFKILPVIHIFSYALEFIILDIIYKLHECKFLHVLFLFYTYQVCVLLRVWIKIFLLIKNFNHENLSF